MKRSPEGRRYPECHNTGYQTIFFVLILMGFVVSGCFSNDGGGGGDRPAGVDNNSVFYGIFEAAVQVGSCDEETSSVLIGNEQDRYPEDNYVYIPEDSNNVIFTSGDEEVEILVDRRSVSITVIGDGYSSYTQLDFSSDYNTAEISGDVTSDDPEDCAGDITGSAVRLDRFTDMEDGTVRDNETGLVWLKDANTFDGAMYLNEAVAAANRLEDGQYGLTDGSNQGDWRLPSKEEWEGLMDTRFTYPALSNTEGSGQWVQGNPFIINTYNSTIFWSRTYFDSINVYVANMNLGIMKLYPWYSYQHWAWPVRDARPNP